MFSDRLQWWLSCSPWAGCPWGCSRSSPRSSLPPTPRSRCTSLSPSVTWSPCRPPSPTRSYTAGWTPTSARSWFSCCRPGGGCWAGGPGRGVWWTRAPPWERRCRRKRHTAGRRVWPCSYAMETKWSRPKNRTTLKLLQCLQNSKLEVLERTIVEKQVPHKYHSQLYEYNVYTKQTLHIISEEVITNFSR